MVRVFLIILITLTLIPCELDAYRPFITEDAGVAQLGENKIELGYDFVGLSAQSLHTTNGSFLVGIGLGGAEIALESPYCLYSKYPEASGLQDIIASAKVKVADVNQDAGFAIKIEYALRSSLYGLSGVFSHSFEIVTLHSQLGWINDYNNNGVLYGLGIDFFILPDFNIIVDLFGEYMEGTLCHNALIGAIITVTGNIVLDVAAGFVWTDTFKNKREVIVTAGCSIALINIFS